LPDQTALLLRKPGVIHVAWALLLGFAGSDPNREEIIEKYSDGYQSNDKEET
jgi:hypothetical protein